MKKILTILGILLIFGSADAQWKKASYRNSSGENSLVKNTFYTLDINAIRAQLASAEESGQYSKPVVISVPTLSGKMEKFYVYSEPVVVKSLADRYQLGSYAGVGIDSPSKFIRFSVAPNDFQSMIISDNGYEFIEPANDSKSVYKVFPKSRKAGGKAFECLTHDRSPIDELYKDGSKFNNSATNFAKSSDKKYRTYRLALSVVGEYGALYGGVAGALAQMNATMTRVNGVFEKDFALKLIMQDFPNIIYTNGANDPYSTMANWSNELMNTLVSQVGQANYDIGHLFGRSGGGGYAGCIGCICSNDTSVTVQGGVTYPNNNKGSGYTSPAAGLPQGDNFDIDYVAHEFGHQLGANHTFSHNVEGAGANMEPGSGSTIMGYAGITQANVQQHSDAYFHAKSIDQVQINIAGLPTCGIATNVVNDPPVIAALSAYTIPKGTAFVLTASATDPQNDPMTFTWEQYNSATAPTSNVNPNSTSAPIFRSLPPSTSPTRYFPRLSDVLNGNLTSQANWETVSNVARALKFRFSARDNHAVATQQQTNFRDQDITVGADGPFTVITGFVNSAGPTNVEWAVANTTSAPYNVANVKIDYTTDNGATWTVISNSTPNDGSETFTFPASLNGQQLKIRVSAIGNVFYAVKTATSSVFVNCDGTAPTNVSVSNVSQVSATVSWAPVANATYIVRYKKTADTAWQTVATSSTSVVLNNLDVNSAYEVQVATVCSGTTGTYSASVNFSTANLTYCASQTENGTDDHIANVSINSTTPINNTTANSTYTSYVNDPALQINLVKGQQYTLSVTKGWITSPYPNAVQAWIDFNGNGIFEDSENIINSPANTTATVTQNFTVPMTAVENLQYRMRVMTFAGQTGAQYVLYPCMTAAMGAWGEVEDYKVMVTSALSTVETVANLVFAVYPNPATDILNVTEVSDKAQYQIINTAGQIVDAGLIRSNKVDITKLVKGNYIITVKDRNFSGSVKFIKK